MIGSGGCVLICFGSLAATEWGPNVLINSNEQIVHLTYVPRMVALPKAPDEKEEAIWDLTRRYLEVMINRELDFKFADNFW